MRIEQQSERKGTKEEQLGSWRGLNENRMKEEGRAKETRQEWAVRRRGRGGNCFEMKAELQWIHPSSFSDMHTTHR